MTNPKKLGNPPTGASPESKLLAAVKAAVERIRTVKKSFGPFNVGDVVYVDEYALTLTVRCCNDPTKFHEGVSPLDYIKWTK